jgi:hypothetical protein
MQDSTAQEIVKKLTAALAERDSIMAGCPIDNPKRGQVFGPNDQCPVCKSTASGSCGRSSSAEYHLTNAVRALLEQTNAK